jgi:hypothetical protein
MPCGCVLLAYYGLGILDGLPRTIHYQIDRFENTSWGFHKTWRETINGTAYISADGSRLNVASSASFRHWVIPDGSSRMRSLYLSGPNEGYEIDQEARTVTGGPCACTWTRFELDRDDPTCVQSASSMIDDPHLEREGRIAGHRVLWFSASRPLPPPRARRTVSVALAPGLACEALEHSHIETGFLDIPYRTWRYRVVSYQAGEPPPDTFRLPPGYRIKKPRWLRAIP